MALTLRANNIVLYDTIFNQPYQVAGMYAPPAASPAHFEVDRPDANVVVAAAPRQLPPVASHYGELAARASA